MEVRDQVSRVVLIIIMLAQSKDTIIVTWEDTDMDITLIKDTVTEILKDAVTVCRDIVMLML